MALTAEGAAPVFTDQEGRFEIAVPASGAFTLRFSKAGFAPRDIAGAAIPDNGVQVRLARGAAVASGRTVDETGAPVADLVVRVRSIGAVANELPVSITTRTDDLGEFRVGSLPAGRYEAAVEDASPRITVNAAGGVTISSPPTPPPVGAAVMPAAPPPPVPAAISIRCDPGTTACRDLFARAEPARADPSPAVVQLRPGEDGSVDDPSRGDRRGRSCVSGVFVRLAAGAEAAAAQGTARSRAPVVPASSPGS